MLVTWIGMRRVDHVYNLSRVDSARYTASPQTRGASIPRFVCQDDNQIMRLQDRAPINHTPVGEGEPEGEGRQLEVGANYSLSCHGMSISSQAVSRPNVSRESSCLGRSMTRVPPYLLHPRLLEPWVKVSFPALGSVHNKEASKPRGVPPHLLPCPKCS